MLFLDYKQKLSVAREAKMEIYQRNGNLINLEILEDILKNDGYYFSAKKINRFIKKSKRGFVFFLNCPNRDETSKIIDDYITAISLKEKMAL